MSFAELNLASFSNIVQNLGKIVNNYYLRLSNKFNFQFSITRKKKDEKVHGLRNSQSDKQYF
jgi:hypothetical protein